MSISRRRSTTKETDTPTTPAAPRVKAARAVAVEQDAEGLAREITAGIDRSALTKKLRAFGSIKPFSTSTVVKPRVWLPTSFPSLDWVIGRGKGVPLGTIVEAYGTKSCGKTTTLLTLAGDMQRRYNAVVLLFDTEGTIDEEMLRRAKIDISPDAFMVVEDEGEDGILNYEKVFHNMVAYLMGLEQIYDEGKVKTPPVIFLWDSVGGTGTKETKAMLEDGGMTSNRIGAQASALTEGMKNIKQLLRKYNVVIMACNQARANIGVMYGEKDKPAGGYVWDHSVDVRVQLSQANRFKNKFAAGKSILEVNGNPVGTILKAYCRKNKVAPPYRETALINIFDYGLDTYQSTILHAVFDLPGVFPEGQVKGYITYMGNKYRIPDLARAFETDDAHWQNFLVQVRAAQEQLQAMLPSEEAEAIMTTGSTNDDADEDGEE